MKQILTILFFTVLIFKFSYSTAQSVGNTFNKATELFNAKKYAESLVKFSEIVDAGFAEHVTYFRRSYCYYYLGKYKEALTDIEKAYEQNPKDHQYFYLKAQAYDKLKQHELTEYYLDLAIKFEPEKLYYYKYRSAYELERGDYKKAEYDFNVLIGANQFDYKSYYGRGLARFNQKKKTDACLDWRFAKDENKGSNRFFFYKCTDVDLRGKDVTPVTNGIVMPPQLNSGLETLDEYLSGRLEYSFDDFRNKEEGTLLVKFRVSKDKSIGDVTVLKSSNPCFEKQVKDVIIATRGKWSKAAHVNGTPVDYTYYLPITFFLNKPEVSVSALLNVMHSAKLAGNHQEVFDVSKKILDCNPFMMEAFKEHTIAAKKLGLPAQGNYMSELKDYKDQNCEVLDECYPNQNYHIIWYNKFWQITHKEEATYYRISYWNEISKMINSNKNMIVHSIKSGFFADYNVSGDLLIKGVYSNDKKDGEFLFYYPDGMLESKLFFKEGQLMDTAYYHYKNGLPQQTIKITPNGFDVLSYYDENGNDLLHEGTGLWEYTKPDYTNKSKLLIKGNYKEYRRDGEWVCIYNNNIILEEKYKNGKLVKGTYYKEGKGNSSGVKILETQISSWIFMPVSLTRTEQIDYAKGYQEKLEVQKVN